MSLGSRPADDPAADAGRFLCRLALIILMVITPGAEVVSRLAIYSLLPVGAVVLCIGGLLAGVGDVPRRLRFVFTTRLGLAAVLLTFWAGLSLIWTPFPGEASGRFTKALVTQVVVLFAIILSPDRTRAANLYLLPIGLTLLSVATLFFSLFGPSYLRGGANPDAAFTQRCSMSLVMLAFPAIGALSLRERWRLAAALAALVTAAALAAYVEIALAAFAIGALAYTGGVTRPTQMAKICGYGFAGLVILAPVLVLVLGHAAAIATHAPFAEAPRMLARLVLHEWPRLITGHGIDMSMRAMDMGRLPPTLPRSLLFQIWYDLGLIGALSFAYLLGGAFFAIGRLAPIYAAPLLGGFVAGLVIAICGAETTQIWWITLNGLNAIAFAIFLKGHVRRKRLTTAAFDEIMREQGTFSPSELT